MHTATRPIDLERAMQLAMALCSLFAFVLHAPRAADARLPLLFCHTLSTADFVLVPQMQVQRALALVLERSF